MTARRAVLTALAVLFALVPLALLEGALRLLGLGDDHPLFVAAAHMPGMKQANPNVVQRYFPGAPDLHIDPIPFAAVKPSDSVRIVVQGGSTAAGFPYGRWAGLAGMLGDRLETSFPERRFEVVSTAMAAVNSYALFDFVDEIIEIEPDAVLIYAGHNEYLGIMGAGSALTSSRFRSATLAHLRLRRLRLYQAIEWAVRLGRRTAESATGGTAGAPGESHLMARAASATSIPFGSRTYRRGLAQFEENLDHILGTYQRSGIPVFVGTLVSNEGDLPPFESGRSGMRKELWRDHRAARASGDVVRARASLLELLEPDDASADAWYALGQLEREDGQLSVARTAFRNARDRDRLPFRAPEAFNGVIRRIASRHGATVVDVQAAFAAESPDGIVGDELILEHVHPNAYGYFLLADSYFEALRAQGVVDGSASVPSRERAAADMPITVIDRILAAHAVRELEAAYPFMDTPQVVPFPRPNTPAERLAARLHAGEIDWLVAMDELMQYHRRRGQARAAIVVARLAAQAYPAESATNYVAGMLYLRAGQPRLARLYLERSLAADPDDLPTRRALRRLDGF